MRRYTRATGLALAGPLLIVLVAAVPNLREEYLFYGGTEQGLEIEVGRGVYAAFGTVVLFGLALGLLASRARTEPVPRPAPAQRSGPPPDGPDDLTVGPAEPLTELSEDHRLGR
jgi:hypothetical protein